MRNVYLKAIVISIVCVFLFEQSFTQNWLINGNTGITGANYLGTINNADLVFRTNALERGRVFGAGGAWRFGSSTDNLKIDSLGRLTFKGQGDYLVGNNKYVFRNSGNNNTGLFFNSTATQYEFRDGSANPVFTVNYNTGAGTFTGSLKVGAYTLPSTDGANNQVLKTDGNGHLTWKKDNNTKYTAGTGISLSSNTITNTAPDQTVSLTGSGGISTSGTYPNFTITNTAADQTVSLTGSTGISTSGTYPNFTITNTSPDQTVSLTGSTGISTSGTYPNFTITNTSPDKTVSLTGSTGISTSGTYPNFTITNTAPALWTINGGNIEYASGDAHIHGITVGYGAGALPSNTAVGLSALAANTSGNYNTAIGNGVLYSNTTGIFNSGYGYRSLFYNTTGNANNANGMNALYSNTTGSYNTATGYAALNNNSSGNNNTATGYASLNSNTTGGNSTANGMYALYNNTTGSENTAIGYRSLFYNTTGIWNTANGNNALYSNTTGNYNTATGYGALYLNTTGENNTAGGEWALHSNTTGNSNTAYGLQSLYNNTTGSGNTAIGLSTLYQNTTGYSNIAIGVGALLNNTYQSNLIAIGDSALFNNGLGIDPQENWFGIKNTAIGSKALYSNTTGYGNTAYGYEALDQNTTGGYNTANGDVALYSNTTGNNNTALGYNADVVLNNLQNAMALGYAAFVNASNKVQVGNTSVTVIGGQVGWSTFSDGRFKKNIKQNVPGLEFINKLNPVTYTLELKKFDQFLGKKDNIINSKESQEGYAVGEKKIHTGFIAQEVEKTAQEIGYDFDGINHPQNEKDNYSLVYADFVPSLVKSVQELSSQNEALKKVNDDQQIQIDDQQKQIDELKAMVASLAQGKTVSSAQSENTISLSSVVLDQNIPNPLRNTTSIGYFIPNNVNQAQLIITNMSGKNLKQITLQNGKGNVTIDASTLSAGAYSYSLLVNGKIVATKKMVVAH